MAKKKKNITEAFELPKNTHISGAGLVEDQSVTETLETNYMPYAMSVILSRALPEIDGFKPSHRKLLYTMYKMGLLKGSRTKSANIVGETMKLNPHGDAAIYETMVRLSKGYEALLHPYVDSKGNFGRAYSSDMDYAASRYTEAKLAQLSAELFRDIEKDTVDFVDNYDNKLKEPTLLPVTFPSVLVNNNIGIAVGMASAICSFNLREVCETTIALMRDEDHDVLSTMPAPDFPGGGLIVYDRDEMAKVYATGRGSVKVRAVYEYDKAANCIDITQIPSTTTVEAIIARMITHIKAGKFKEISDIRNEIGLQGLKITIDLKRGTDPDRLMAMLFATTPLEDNFACNFNILIGTNPRVLGVRDILLEWVQYRTNCVRRRITFDLNRAKEKLHLLEGLAKILLDIDKAISIIRETEQESEVIPNLMIGFGIDQIQAEYVAEIRLRHLNREYILKRTDEIDSLKKDIDEMLSVLESKTKLKNIIIAELKDVAKKHGQDRKSQLIYADEIKEVISLVEEIPDYPCFAFFTKEGYFKKIGPQSLRMGSNQLLKDGDEISQEIETSNNRDLLFFTDKFTVYKSKMSDFGDTKASALGEYVPSKLDFDEDEKAKYMVVTEKYTGFMLFFFENGKIAKVDLSGYYTKTNRKKLVNAYSDKSPLVAVFHIESDMEFVLTSTSGRRLLLHSGAVSTKTSKNTIGVQAMTLKGKHKLSSVEKYRENSIENEHRYRTKTLPAAGSLPPKDEFLDGQMTL